MQITYDAEADAMLITLRPEAAEVEGIDVAPDMIASLDMEGEMVALEVLDARKKMGDAVFAGSVPIEQLAPVPQAAVASSAKE